VPDSCCTHGRTPWACTPGRLCSSASGRRAPGGYGGGAPYAAGQLPQRSPKGRGGALYAGGSPARGAAPAYGRGAAGGRAAGADAPGGRGRGRRGGHAELGDPYGGGVYGGYGGAAGAVPPGKAALAASFRAERFRQELPQRAYAVLQQARAAPASGT